MESSSTDAAAKEREDKQNQLKHKMGCGNCIKRRDTCEENEHKAHAVFREHCSKALKAKAESRANSESQIHNDPAKLLERV